MLMLQIMLSKETAETYGPSRSAKGFLLATDILDGALLSDNPCLLCGLLCRRRALTGNDLFLRLSTATAGRVYRTPALSWHPALSGSQSSHSPTAVQFMLAV